MKENILKKHPSLLLQQDIADICQPFLKKFNFQVFNLIRLDNDDSVSYLCDNRDWLLHYLINNYPHVGAFEQNLALRKEQHVLWSAFSEDDPIVIDSRKMFNVKFGVTIIQPFERGYYFFNFGTTSNDISTLNRINSQIDELNTFTKLFLEKSRHLIAKVAKQPFRLEDFSSSYKPVIKNDRLYLGVDYGYNYLTSKEIIYLQQLTGGSTAPEIATLNNISTRTIEKHLENIKNKLFCKTQCELGYIVAKLGIDSL